MRPIPAWTALLGCAAIAGIGFGACARGPGNGENFVCPGTETAKVQQALLIPRCATSGCHDGTSRANGLDLASPDVEARVVDAPVKDCPTEMLVVPGHPESSTLVLSCAGEPTCAEAMPLDEPALSTNELTCLKAWVTSLGAVENPCGSDQQFCGGKCVDTQTDSTNCGKCNYPCPGGGPCVDGQCACPLNETRCNGFCVDESSSSTDCGVCGHACGTSEVCVAGHCMVGG